MADSHRSATPGEYWATLCIYDARTWDRCAIACSSVTVAPGAAPGDGSGGWDADLLAALDRVHADPWQERRPDYAVCDLATV